MKMYYWNKLSLFLKNNNVCPCLFYGIFETKPVVILRTSGLMAN